MESRSLQEAAAAGAGVGIGAGLGLSIGVVGVFGGIAATWPLALLVGAGSYGFVKVRNLRKENARLKALIAEDMDKVQ